MPVDFESDQTTNDAMTRLMDAESKETPIPQEKFVQADEPVIPADDNSESKGETPNKSESDTRAAAKQAPEPKDTKTEPKTDATAGKSKFTADAIRRDTSWKALVAEKESFRKEMETFTQQKQQLERQQQDWQTKQAKSSQKYTPEQYEQAAVGKDRVAEQMLLEADGLDNRAAKFEEAGEHGKAELAKQQAQDKRAEANGEKYSAKQMRSMAEHVRKNPDPTLQQLQAKNEQAIQQYTVKAAEKWPELAKQGSDLQKAVSAILTEAKANGLDENDTPVLRYHAVRLAAAELGAARVPDLEKELGAAKAKVKELEAFTAPGGGQGSAQTQASAKSFDEMSDAEQETFLRQQANAR